MARYMEVEAFKAKVQKAMDRVKIVLHSEKVPQFAADVHHRYEDKYLLAERMTNAALASQLNSLGALGLTPAQAATLREWSKTSQVSLRFRAEQRCEFSREASREVGSPTKRVEQVTGALGAVQAALTSKVVTTVTEYFWTLRSSYELTAIRGVGQEPGDRLVICQREGQDELITTTKVAPRPEVRSPAKDVQVNVSWLLANISSDPAACPVFKINREDSACHTPRRNREVDAGFEHFVKVAHWAKEVAAYVRELLAVQPDPTKKLDISSLRSSSVFLPLLPLLQSEGQEAVQPTASSMARDGALALIDPQSELAGAALMPAADMNALLAEESRALVEQIGNVKTAIPSGNMVATSAEAQMSLVLSHCADVCEQWSEVLGYIEGMLRKQLIEAIGKEATPADFAEYMRFHARRLFLEDYAPAPFCFAVRRSERHSPEGTLSIEETKIGGGDGAVAAPVVTLASRSLRERPMEFALNASTNVSFLGDVYLHAHLSHQFSGQSGAALSLVSRARQFSSFIVLVGRIASANSFEPKFAAIVQNKDELSIPLEVSTIPTPKEFKDAIESLSPEQQRFAKAFRAMQLESTLFGILTIQIKPQLERVLNLPPDSLTKEIKLTQDLMKLFTEFQIPTDLLSFDGRDDVAGVEIPQPSPQEALEAVRGHVKAMHEMIEQAKREEIEQAKQEAVFENPLYGRGAGSSDSECGLDDEAEERYMELQADCFDGDGERSAPRALARNVVALKSCAPMGKGGGKGGAPQRRGFGYAPRSAASAPMPCPPPCAVALSSSAAPPPPPPEAGQTAPASPAPVRPSSEDAVGQGGGRSDVRDYTKVPKEMDAKFEALDTDGALRPTIISPGDVWTKRAQKALLQAKPVETQLTGDAQKREKDATFDLLDALTKSGALQVDCASLHVVVAATHCFDKTVTETVVQDNVSPIEKVERSMLIMASTVHRRPPAALVQESQRERLASASPMLFLEDEF